MPSPSQPEAPVEREHIRPYVFTRNDPFDKHAPIQYVVPRYISSPDYMRSIRAFAVPADAIAIWYLGQNGFLLKGPDGPLVGIDLYLTNSCAALYAHLPFRLDRQLPIFIEPEDLDVDVFLTTHSHEDHADAETIQRMHKTGSTLFVGPWDAQRIFRESGVPPTCTRLIHPGESIPLGGGTTLQATFALPTDHVDLNHTGSLLTFANGITFYNTGDTGYAPRLATLLPTRPDICAICINGGFHNLVPNEAAEIIRTIRPRVAIPCHYDMMVNNVGSPDMLRIALLAAGSDALFHQMTYYEPWLYRRADSSDPKPPAPKSSAQRS